MKFTQSKRWPLLFLSLFFFILFLVPVQYEAETALPSDATPESIAATMNQGLEVKLPHFQAFGLAVLIMHLNPDTGLLRMSPVVQPFRGKPTAVPGAIMHVLFSAFVLAHLLTIMIGKSVFRLRDDQTTFFSMAYFRVLLGSVFAAVLLGLDAWSVFDAALKHPDLALWLEQNTNLHDQTYATLLGTSVTVVVTLIVTAARETQCPTLLQKLYYFCEAFIILELFFNSFTNIDVFLFILSHPFPAFSPDFNPFISREWIDTDPTGPSTPTLIERLMRGTSASSAAAPIGL